MPRITLGRYARLATLLFAAVLSLGIATTASADTPLGREPGASPTPTPTPAGRCAVLQVQLNGDQPAAHNCLAPAPDGQRTDQPAQGQVAQLATCPSGHLQLFVDTNFGGAKICFGGSGVYHLDYYTYYEWWGPAHVPRSWNDKLSSFRTGQYYVNFYEHGHATGAKLRYASYQSRSSMPSGWNDRVSSLCVIGYPNYSCP